MCDFISAANAAGELTKGIFGFMSNNILAKSARRVGQINATTATILGEANAAAIDATIWNRRGSFQTQAEEMERQLEEVTGTNAAALAVTAMDISSNAHVDKGNADEIARVKGDRRRRMGLDEDVLDSNKVLARAGARRDAKISIAQGNRDSAILKIQGQMELAAGIGGAASTLFDAYTGYQTNKKKGESISDYSVRRLMLSIKG